MKLSCERLRKTGIFLSVFLIIAINCINVSASVISKKSSAVKKTEKRDKAVNNFNTPDFAFPETVEINAEKVLGDALKSGKDIDALKAAMQVTVAKDLVSKDNYTAGLKLFGDLSEKLNTPYSQLALLLEAQIYVEIYQSQSWTFNNRVIPTVHEPENVMEWSRDIFSHKVISLVKEALANAEISRSTPLTSISGILEDSEDAEKIGMSVYDFMVIKSVSLLSPFQNNSAAVIIPFVAGDARSEVNDESDAGTLAVKILDSDIEWHDKKGELQLSAAMSLIKVNSMSRKEGMAFSMECLVKYKDTPYCAPFIIMNAKDGYDEFEDDESAESELEKRNAVTKAHYKEITDYLERFPDCDGSQALRNTLSDMASENISVNTVGRMYPGDSGKINVSSSNVKDFNLLVVKLSETYLNKTVNTSQIKSGKIVETIAINFTGEIPQQYEKEFAVSPLSSGVYAVIPSRTDNFSGIITGISPRMSFPTFNVSRLVSFTSNGDDKSEPQRLYVADGKNGKPIQDAKVTLKNRYNSKTPSQINKTTNSEGYIELPAGSYDVTISKGPDMISSDVWGYGSYNSDSHEIIRGDLLTDLSIYHPGDSIGFVGILYKEADRKLSVIADSDVEAILYDANSQKADSLKLKSDRFGRVTGKFSVPVTGLLGSYRISLISTGNDPQSYCSKTVEVAEYKSPTFHVITDGVQEDFELGDTIRIKGSALTYAGMPVANAAVKFNVRYVSWRWPDSDANAEYGGKTVTDASGNFIIELPTEGLRHTRYAFGGYEMNIDVTDQSGETQQAPAVWFSLGKAYSITTMIPEKIDADAPEETYAVKVTDITGKPVKQTVCYTVAAVADEKKILKSGEFESPAFKFDFSTLKSGKYKLSFSLKQDGSEKDNDNPDFERVSYVKEVIIYRMSDKVPPVETALWTPQERIIASKDTDKIRVKVGSSYKNSYIFLQLSDCDKVIRREWMKVDGDIVEITIPSPAENNRLSLYMLGTHDFKSVSQSVSIIPEIQTEKVKITGESFRDQISPGGKESWKFRFSFEDRSLAGIPVSAVMSNEALNDIMPFSWNFNPYSTVNYIISGNVRMLYVAADRSWNVALTKPVYTSVPQLTQPDWNLYGLQLYGGSVRNMLKVRGRGVRVVASKSANTASFESADACEEEVMLYDSVAAEPMSNNMMKKESVSASAVVTAGGVDDADTPPLREIECPLAFFMPTLLTDENGDALIDFTVPDFNGTWQFQIMGYTPDMRAGVAKMSSVATKPVMVKMNAPRFVRTGDMMNVTAMVYNNSAEALRLKGKIEIFDPTTGKVYAFYESAPREVSAAESEKISLEYSVPDDVNCLGIRVYGFGGEFRDGEQTVVAVLPSSTPVLESKIFYVAPGSNDFSMKLPDSGNNSTVTLQYSDNPIWEVVTALPQISEPKSANVLSQIYSLYGNAIGRGLAEDYPEIVEAIKIFSDPVNSQDSTLISNLEKNQNLKNVLLNNTPWVRNAASESMRMQSLVKYADSKEAERIIERTLKEIEKLQNSDGGWSWCAGMPSSDYITGRVLLHLGMLNSMGYLPSDAAAMAVKGIKFSDASWVKSLKEYKGKKFPYESMLNYLYVRSMFKDVKASSEFGMMISKGLAAVKESWKKTGIYEKATAATLLNRSGYRMEARTILESLRQYASVSAEKGMWFDNLSSSFRGWNKLITTAQVLEAYAEIEPESVNIDKIRQWLLITKQAENWGDDRDTSEVIHAILSSGTKWTVPSAPAEISIGGEKIEMDHIAQLTGSVTVNIPNNKRGMLTIKRHGAGPAWGGVVTQYVAPIAKVKSEGMPELRIEKNLYVIADDEHGTKATSGKLAVGDKVRVTLTLTTDRDLEYVAVMDARSACLEPTEQVSGYTASDGLWMYKEVRNESTNLFIPFLSKGTHVVSYECFVDREGTYSLGIASAQSQYTPIIAAHSAGNIVEVKK